MQEIEKELSRESIVEELKKYAAIVASSDDAIVSKTLEGIIVSWNQGAEQLFGYSADEAIGQHITLIIPPELHQEEEEIIQKVRSEVPIQHFDTVRMRKDGTRVYVSLSISPVKDAGGKIVGAAKIARDISERRELEQRKDEFISIASHELKTPITALKGLAQILLRRLERQSLPDEVAMMRRMEKQIDRLTKLTNELLDASKIQIGSFDYIEEQVDLREMMKETIELLQPSYNTHMLFVKDVPEVVLRGDKDRLGQALINLISNAVKYSPQADKVDIEVTASERLVTIRVRDYGVGISKEHQKFIFERFYRVSEKQNKGFSGLGMGLYIADEIVRQHGGEIVVESEEGKGSIFVVMLPRGK